VSTDGLKAPVMQLVSTRRSRLDHFVSAPFAWWTTAEIRPPGRHAVQAASLAPRPAALTRNRTLGRPSATGLRLGHDHWSIT
jgi:hypothetical protein